MSTAVCQTLLGRTAICAWLALGCALGCATPWAQEVRKASQEQGGLASQALGNHSDEILVSDRSPKGKLVKAVYGPPTAGAQLETVVASDANSVAPSNAAPSITTKGTPVTGTAAPTIAETQALGAALAELQEVGAIDSATHTQLLDSLQQTDPVLWPQLLAYFRTAATRRQPSPVDQPTSAEVQLASATKPVIEVSSSPPASKPAESSQESAVLETKVTEPSPAAEPASTETSSTEEEEQPPPPKKTKKAKRKKASPTPKKETLPEDWQHVLAASIDRLEKQTAQPPSNNAEVGQHAALRMMYLAAGRREDALKPIEGIPPSQQDFWAKELYGLSAYLDQTRNPDASRRAAEANQHFREASARLGEIATLQVRNLSFCKEVGSYGVYKPFEASNFQSGQELLLYAEVENFKSEHKDRGYHTALKASYQILDERGARVDEKEFAVTEEYCQNPRRDFFVRYFIWMPQKIYGGKYTLQLTVEDTLSQKIGQASVEFNVTHSGESAP